MKQLLTLLLVFVTVCSFAQKTWVKWNGHLFLKQGSDSIYYGEDEIWSTIPGIVTGINARLSPNGNGSALTGLTASQVGLANVDNTNDANKPVSTAQQTALNLKANLASPNFTGTVGGITPLMVSLGNVDNTSDANKPVSSATQTALNAKLATNGDGSSLTGLTKSQVGLGNLDNTSDANKPVSTATQTALNGKLATNGSAASLTSVPVNQATGVLPFANGGRAGSAATSATTGTITVSMSTSVITITPTGACTFNASGGVVGQISTFIITTSGTTSFTLTWGTNYRKTGTLATGTTSARFFAVSFVCVDGTIWQEISRTAVQT